MKKLALFVLLTLLAFFGYAQCTNSFYTMQEGAYYEMEYYNGKDKLQSKQQHTVTEVVPAGNGYEATISKITYNLNVNMKIMGMGRQTDYSGSEWIAEGVGMVRNEQYDKKGKLTSYSILTQAKK